MCVTDGRVGGVTIFVAAAVGGGRRRRRRRRRLALQLALNYPA